MRCITMQGLCSRICKPKMAIEPAGPRFEVAKGAEVISEFDRLAQRIRACSVCRDAPRYGPPLPHDPRPVFQATPSARLCIVSQAPGARAHASGKPYTDPSG